MPGDKGDAIHVHRCTHDIIIRMSISGGVSREKEDEGKGRVSKRSLHPDTFRQRSGEFSHCVHGSLKA